MEEFVIELDQNKGEKKLFIDRSLYPQVCINGIIVAITLLFQV